MENNKAVLFELNIENDRCIFPNTISDAIIDANKELKDLEDKLNETLETISLLTPECDKLDYILSASSGALCGIIDVFLVGKPGESPLGDITDKWFANRTIDFAKICGYTGDKNSLSSAIKFLEKKFKIPYDQSVGGGIFRELIELTPSNHHFKSLGHNPTLLELSERITRIDEESKLLRDAIVKIKSFGTDYDAMTEAQQYELGAYVNLMLSSTQLLVNPILGLQPKYGNEDFEKFVSWKGRKTDKALCNDFKTLIISFANLLYKIDLDDNDKRLLYKTFKGNKKMLSALNMKKKEFKIEILNVVEEALLYSYK